MTESIDLQVESIRQEFGAKIGALVEQMKKELKEARQENHKLRMQVAKLEIEIDYLND